MNERRRRPWTLIWQGSLAAVTLVAVAASDISAQVATELGPAVTAQPSASSQSAIDRQLGVQDSVRWWSGLPPTATDYAFPLNYPFSYVAPPPYFRAARQPTGHRITPTSPNGYVYEPVYDVEQPSAAVAPPVGSAPITDQPPSALNIEQQLLRSAVTAFRAGQYQDALRHLDNLQALRPKHGPPGLLRVQAQLALGNFSAAIDALRAATAQIPEHQWGLILESFGDYYSEPARLADHLQRLAAHIDANPKDANARLLQAFEYGFLGHHEIAANELSQAAQLAPQDSLINRLLPRFSPPPPAPPESVTPPSGVRAF